MHGDFCWRQSEDEPTVAYVDVRQLQGVAQKSAVSLRILAVDDRMRSSNHNRPRPQIGDCCRKTPNQCRMAVRAGSLSAYTRHSAVRFPRTTASYAACISTRTPFAVYVAQVVPNNATRSPDEKIVEIAIR